MNDVTDELPDVRTTRTAYDEIAVVGIWEVLSRLPGARLTFEHVIDPREAGVRITHRARLDGPFAALYARRVRAVPAGR